MLGVALCASCAVVVGLEDKQPYPIETSEAAPPIDGTEKTEAGAEAPPPDSAEVDAGHEGGGEVIATGQASPYGIVVDEAYLYWTNEANGKVMRRLKTLAAPPE